VKLFQHLVATISLVMRYVNESVSFLRKDLINACVCNVKGFIIFKQLGWCSNFNTKFMKNVLFLTGKDKIVK